MATKKRTKTVAATANPVPVPAIETEKQEMSFSSAVSIQERIALLAYSYWEQRGRPSGSPEEDWYRAEQEILGQASPAES
jgi:hypothetical protein